MRQEKNAKDLLKSSKEVPPIFFPWDPSPSPSFSHLKKLYQQLLLFKLYFKSHVCGSHTYLCKDDIGGKCDNICSYMENESTDVPMHVTKYLEKSQIHNTKTCNVYIMVKSRERVCNWGGCVISWKEEKAKREDHTCLLFCKLSVINISHYHFFIIVFIVWFSMCLLTIFIYKYILQSDLFS